MNKELLIFGSNGALGSGVVSVLSKKNFNNIYLFNQGENKNKLDGNNIVYTQIDDLSIEDNTKKAFDVVKTGKDKLLFLFSTIGGYIGGKNIWEISSDEVDRMVNINIKTNFYLAKYFAQKVKECAGGSIIFTAAYVGIHPEKTKSIYGATKAALIHLVKTLALEGKEINLTANVIAPFIIDTPANREWETSGDYEGWIKTEEIGEIAFDIFNKFNFYNSNVIELKTRFELK
ncbi:MAG TPA: SDR family NAD(P)-dependent oxidoreductase [Ignavibacteriaceae bacterium]|nr:SDR family NAD(P)-dependent oxidoreductase [Ignavibacteriaceae bacterium]